MALPDQKLVVPRHYRHIGLRRPCLQNTDAIGLQCTWLTPDCRIGMTLRVQWAIRALKLCVCPRRQRTPISLKRDTLNEFSFFLNEPPSFQFVGERSPTPQLIDATAPVESCSCSLVSTVLQYSACYIKTYDHTSLNVTKSDLYDFQAELHGTGSRSLYYS